MGETEPGAPSSFASSACSLVPRWPASLSKPTIYRRALPASCQLINRTMSLWLEWASYGSCESRYDSFSLHEGQMQRLNAYLPAILLSATGETSSRREEVARQASIKRMLKRAVRLTDCRHCAMQLPSSAKAKLISGS